MTQPDPGRRYYVITVTATQDGKLRWETQSRFEGYTEHPPRREIRVPCEVIPARMIAIWKELRQPYVVVTTRSDLGVFVMVGGNALVDADLAAEHFDFVNTGIEVAPDGLCSTVELWRVPVEHTQRAPTPKARMAVIKRDQHRCVICGRRPADYVDVELNVHHIRPWAEGGLTKPNNLITICRTCHKGLEPHFDWELYGLIPEPRMQDMPTVEEATGELAEGVRRYRVKVMRLIREQRHEGENKRGEDSE